MAINISIEKRHLYLLSAILIFLAGISIVVAYDWTTGSGTGLPSIHGHTANEIEGGVSGEVYPNCKGPAGYVYADGTEWNSIERSNRQVGLKCEDGKLYMRIQKPIDSGWMEGTHASIGYHNETETSIPKLTQRYTAVLSGEYVVVTSYHADSNVQVYYFTIPEQYIISEGSQ